MAFVDDQVLFTAVLIIKLQCERVFVRPVFIKPVSGVQMERGAAQRKLRCHTSKLSCERKKKKRKEKRRGRDRNSLRAAPHRHGALWEHAPELTTYESIKWETWCAIHTVLSFSMCTHKGSRCKVTGDFRHPNASWLGSYELVLSCGHDAVIAAISLVA